MGCPILKNLFQCGQAGGTGNMAVNVKSSGGKRDGGGGGIRGTTGVARRREGLDGLGGGNGYFLREEG